LAAGVSPVAGLGAARGGQAIEDALWELNALALPLAGLSVLGAAGIVRDMLAAEEDPAIGHRPLILVWIVAALALWLFRRASLGPLAPATEVWKTLLTVPLMITAALGLIGIAERRVGFWPALAAGSLTLVDTVLLLERSRGGALGPAGESSSAESSVLALVLA